MKANCASIIGWVMRRRFTKALKIRWQPSKGANLCLIIGDNASGKSLFRRGVSSWCAKDYNFDTQRGPRIENINLSMEGRSGGSMYGPLRGIVYGDEANFATGSNTANLVTGGIKTATGRDKPHVVFWDEPDTGLSDEYAANVGQRIAEFSKNKPDNTIAMFVVTHRRSLVEYVMAAKPHVLFFGDGAPKTVEDFLTRKVVPADIEELGERGHKLFLKINSILKEKE